MFRSHYVVNMFCSISHSYRDQWFFSFVKAEGDHLNFSMFSVITAVAQYR